MSQHFDLHTLPLKAEQSLALSRQLIEQRQTEFIIELADGPIIMTGRRLFVNIFAWRPLVARGLPVYRRHTSIDGLFTKDVLAKIGTEIYVDEIARYPLGATPPLVERKILYDICETINDLHTAIAKQLGAYHVSISIFELADLMTHPEIAPLAILDISKELQISIAAAEKKRSDLGDLMMKKLLDRSIPSNIIAPFLELGLLSKAQLPQVTVALGFRTDAADTPIRWPITTSYIDGIKDIKSYAVESLSAKKTVYYNRNAMPDSQYSNRKQQIIASAIRRLYPGDCGTTLTVPFFIHRGNAKHVYAKNIVADGQLVTLSRDNIERYVGTTVNFRSPLTCRHTDGICHVCGGKLTDFMMPQSVVGIASTIEYMSAATQLVLSAKHFSLVKAVTYKIPDALHDFLVIRQNDIYIRENVDVSNLKIGIQFGDMSHVNELQHMDEETTIAEQQFSTINYLTFATDNDAMLTPEVLMVAESSIPYFSSEMLVHIRSNFKSLAVGDMIWIPLKRFDHQNEPILRCVIESNSMIKFNKTLERFTDKDIRAYTSLADVLCNLTEIVYQEISTNIMHIEVVLKAYLITSDNNYNIPKVLDPNNVRFGDLDSIISHRSLGEQYAFEKLKGFLADPVTFISPHKRGIFDVFHQVD